VKADPLTTKDAKEKQGKEHEGGCPFVCCVADAGAFLAWQESKTAPEGAVSLTAES
jgi:hypothetical protein